MKHVMKRDESEMKTELHVDQLRSMTNVFDIFVDLKILYLKLVAG